MLDFVIFLVSITSKTTRQYKIYYECLKKYSLSMSIYYNFLHWSQLDKIICTANNLL